MIGVAVIGAGRIGELHARHLLGSVNGASLVCLVDVERTRAERIAQGRPVFDRIEQALELREVQAVVLASPTDLHAHQIELCAAAGKAIFCEKPVGLEVDRSEKALAAARAKS